MKSEGMNKIIILYGSSYGSTAEVAIRIGEILKEDGVGSHVYNLKDIMNDKNFNLEDYRGIILGSGIYAGQWNKGAKKFMKTYSEKIKERNLSFGMFVLCGEASKPSKIPELKKRFIEEKLNKYNVKSQLCEVFGGVVDLSEDTNLGRFTLKLLKMINKKDPNVKLGQRNDFRDWDQIRVFTEDFSNILRGNLQ